MNKKAQVSVWGLMYAILCVVIGIVFVRLMNPGWFWGLLTIVVLAAGGYFFGGKASGEW